MNSAPKIVAPKIVIVDCDYLFPRFAASYLIVKKGHAVVIDNGTARSIPRVLEAIQKEGLTPADVDFAIVTHVHLDHAGGSSALMKACPNATLLAHPRATKHLIDPSKLVASAQKVYGEETFQKLYGTIEPIPADRIGSMADGEKISWSGIELKFLHTRGHANHHACILLSWEGAPQAIFTGDSFGLCYPDLQREGLFVFPSTSPTDFDAAEAKASVRRIADSGARVAYPTHFGPIHDIAGAAAQLQEELDFSESLLNEATGSGLPDERLEAFCRERIGKHFPSVFERRGRRWSEEADRIIRLDMDLNAQGIAYVAAKKRKA